MRILTIITGFICGTAFMVVAETAAGQAPLDKKVSVSFDHVLLKTALVNLSDRTGVKFMYSGRISEEPKRITLSVKDVVLKTVLDKILDNLPYSYTVVDEVIIIKDEPKKKVSAITQEHFEMNLTIKGKITDEKGKPLAGASIRLKGTNRGTQTDDQGNYRLTDVPENAILIISFIGYRTEEIKVSGDTSFYSISLSSDNSNQLNQVTVVSTGYQDIPQERATGSFVKIDSAVFNRRVGTNVIDRLEGVTSGLIFNKNVNSLDPNSSNISIRGLSTIFANKKPLIVVDNFPYDGDINNINPNDVESVTVLKDAASASIWGARSGNGVIVIKTKMGKRNQPLRVDMNANLTIGQKPDLYYNPNYLDAVNFISVERYLFNQGFYDANLASTNIRPVETPVIDLLNAARNGTISQAEADAQINVLKNNDVRKDFNKYFYRNSADQQYALNLTGGGEKTSYLFSVGYDKNLSELVRNGYDRITVNSNNSFEPIRNLHLTVGVHYAQSSQQNNNPGFGGVTSNNNVIYPYARLADNKGNPLPVAKDYPLSYVTTQTSLLDWQYRPLQELQVADIVTTLSDTRINPAISYQLFKGLNAEVRYQYEKSFSETNNLQSSDSYFTRNLINQYTQVNSDGSLTYAIPLGAINDKSVTELTDNNIRALLNYNNTFELKHSIAAIAGVEIQDLETSSNLNRLYGYDPKVGTSAPVDYVTQFNKYQDVDYPSGVPYVNTVGGTTDEFRSYFANASYTYDDRYIISGSARFDQSNLFGVTTNQKGVPLWSAGLGWNMSREAFYHSDALPYLKFRATYGYNGNLDKTVTAFTTGQYWSGSIVPLPGVSLISPPNPYLQWEKINMLDLGLDFETKDKIVSGTIEYYHKTGSDMLGYSPLDPTTGFNNYKANVANIAGHGIDVTINTRNIRGKFKWNSSLLLSTTTSIVTKYFVTSSVAGYLQSGDGSNGTNNTFFTPVVGKPVFSVFSLRWAGLDPANGDPRGYLNGQVSKDYASILSSRDLNQLVYNGSATPTKFGSFRNDFSYAGFGLSFDITYKFGYYFRRPSINYDYLFNLYIGNKDFSKRWQNPGDEKSTNVPSMTYPANSSRDEFYTYSQALIDKGDNIRLQDVRFSYEFNKEALSHLPFKKLQIYIYANNLGLLWKANKDGLDPDFVGGYPTALYPNPRTVSFGLNASF